MTQTREVEEVLKEVRVLIITGKTNVSVRQLPHREPYIRRGNRLYRFYINDITVEPDVVVVRNKYLKKKQTFRVAPQNTILMLSEPASVVRFPQRYCNQFGLLYSCQADQTHRNVVYGPALLPWFVGVTNKDGASYYSMNYDDLKNAPSATKTKLISVITSNKAFTTGHQRRLRFVAKLKERYGDLIDVFGRGIRDFDDKWDVLAPYKYHIAIENSSSEHYWTEKLSDCFLARTFPIYYGCPNAADYFPADSFASIDIDDFEGACAVINSLISKELSPKQKDAVEEARGKTLDSFNMFSIIADCCDRLDVLLPKQDVCLKPSKTILNLPNFYNYVVKRNLLLLKNKISSLLGKNTL